MIKKSYLYTLVAIILVVIGILAYKSFNKNSNKPANVKQEQGKVVPNEVTQLETKQVPKGFPVDFPFESGAQVVQNYESKGQESVQYTRQILSVKKMAENYSGFLSYLSGKNWQIVSKSDQADIKIITASLGNKILTITITPDQLSKKNLVSVTLLEKN